MLPGLLRVASRNPLFRGPGAHAGELVATLGRAHDEPRRGGDDALWRLASRPRVNARMLSARNCWTTLALTGTADRAMIPAFRQLELSQRMERHRLARRPRRSLSGTMEDACAAATQRSPPRGETGRRLATREASLPAASATAAPAAAAGRPALKVLAGRAEASREAGTGTKRRPDAAWSQRRGKPSGVAMETRGRRHSQPLTARSGGRPGRA